MSTPIRGNNATVTPDSSVTVPADGGYGYVAAPAEQSDTNAPAAELPPVSWTTKLKSKKQEAFHVRASGNET